MQYPLARAIGISLIWLTAATAQMTFEQEPILYGKAESHDRVAQLEAALGRNEQTLNYDPRLGYLPAVLELLEIPPSSQMLVFSKTSFQLQKISPHRPRAVYFNDDTYVGWVPNGDVLEFAAVDPQLGTVFYTLDQKARDAPRFVRDRGECISCHASGRTQHVPGLLVRSVFADKRGQPQLGSGSFTTDHRSPFGERWGGWYVTGTHGTMRHMGNVTVGQAEDASIDRESGANRVDLAELLDTKPYLRPSSDLVALMVLEHQTQVHNALIRANYEARQALHYDRIMNEALGRAADYQSDATRRRIATAGDNLVEHLLLSKEFRLASEVSGTSEFAAEYGAAGPRDLQGRSLRELDLKQRLFKYPCSPLIYSASFDQLPQPVKEHVTSRLREVLAGRDQTDLFSHLSADDRVAIGEILRETKPELNL